MKKQRECPLGGFPRKRNKDGSLQTMDTLNNSITDGDNCLRENISKRANSSLGDVMDGTEKRFTSDYPFNTERADSVSTPCTRLEIEIQPETAIAEIKGNMNKYKCDENGVYLMNSGKKISNYIEIKEIITNIEDSTCKAILKYKSFEGIKERTVNRENYLNKRNLISLQKYGVDITNSNSGQLEEHLRECENNALVKKVHSKLGFSKNGDKEIYNLYNSIGIDSEYVGNYELKPQGSRDEYVEMLKREVIGKCELEFAVISGLSAIPLAFVGEELGLDTMIIHLVGNSTTGKSTALKLAISMFGYPDVKKTGLYGTYNGTNNALLKKLTWLKGVPYAIDEISMSNTTNFTNFIYALANGTDKDRLNKECEIIESATWLTTILSNGEKSLIGSASKNAGVQIRVMEASNFEWTKSAENSETINNAILKNYGHLGIEFASYVISIGKSKLIQQFKVIKENLYKIMDEKLILDNMAMRRCNKYAILLQTAKLFQNMMDIKLDIEGITSMILKIEEQSLSNRNFGVSAIDYIKQYVSKYKNKFDDGGKTYGDIFGKIIQKKSCTELQMNKIAFNDMIISAGYENKNIVLKELKNAGKLSCEKGRLTRSRNNSLGYKEEVYVVIIDGYELLGENPVSP